MDILAIQHVPFEGPGAIADWAAARAFPLRILHPYAGDALPEATFPGLLVVLGGPMNVDEAATYPFLAEEKGLLAARAAADLPTLGICLGAQLLAAALGAPVTPNGEKEIGWFPVRCSPAGRTHPLFDGFPDAFPVLHWHGDTFAIPAGAVPLATGDGCLNQAFAVGTRLAGLQFHLEAGPAAARAMLDHAGDELAAAQGGRWIATPEAIRRDSLALAPQAAMLLFRLLDRLAGC